MRLLLNPSYENLPSSYDAGNHAVARATRVASGAKLERKSLITPAILARKCVREDDELIKTVKQDSRENESAFRGGKV